MRTILISFLLSALFSPLIAAPLKFGIFDISFHGIENLLSQRLDANYVVTPHHLYSPHGAAVASLLADPQYGGTSNGLLTLMNTGIDEQAFKQGLKLAQDLDVKVVNISMHLRSKGLVDLLNEHHQKFGTVFIVSAGNSAQRFGRSLPDYYDDFKGLVASCLDLDASLPDFAQLSERVDFLMPCGVSNILTRIDDLHLGVREHLFGMTSAAAPQLSAMVIDILSQTKQVLSLEDIKKNLEAKSIGSYTHDYFKTPILDPHLRIQPLHKLYH